MKLKTACLSLALLFCLSGCGAPPMEDSSSQSSELSSSSSSSSSSSLSESSSSAASSLESSEPPAVSLSSSQAQALSSSQSALPSSQAEIITEAPAHPPSENNGMGGFTFDGYETVSGISIRIKDSQGRPYVNTVVILKFAENNYDYDSIGYVDDQGIFSCREEAQFYTGKNIAVVQPPSGSDGETLIEEIPFILTADSAGKTIDITTQNECPYYSLPAQTNSIRVRILDEDDQPIPGLRLNLLKEGGGNPDIFPSGNEGRTFSDGTFWYGDREPGNYELQVRIDSWGPYLTHYFFTVEAGEKEYDFVLPAQTPEE